MLLHRACALGGALSFLVAATAPALAGGVRITEVLAANTSVNADEAGEFDDWIELGNEGTASVDVGGLFLSDEPGSPRKWEVPSATLGPGERLLIWADEDTGQGPFHVNFKLSAQGESVLLFDTIANGNGLLDRMSFGLQSQDISFGRLGSSDYDRPEYLTPPTPGEQNASSSPFSDICINEFLTTSAGGGIDDWIEFHNRGTTAIDLGGWGISDDILVPMKYVIPPSTMIAAGGFIFVDETVLGFGLASSGEVIMLTDPDGVTGRDYIDFGVQVADVSLGRYRDGAPRWFQFSPPTPGGPNQYLTVSTPTEAGAFILQATPLANPSPGAAISFTLVRDEHVRVSVFDSTGRRVHVVSSTDRGPGEHVVRWDGIAGDTRVAAGRYWVLIESRSDAVSVPISITR